MVSGGANSVGGDLHWDNNSDDVMVMVMTSDDDGDDVRR